MISERMVVIRENLVYLADVNMPCLWCREMEGREGVLMPGLSTETGCPVMAGLGSVLRWMRGR